MHRCRCRFTAIFLAALSMAIPSVHAMAPVDAAAMAVHEAYPAAPTLVFGEIHGTREAPALIAALATRAAATRDVIVALEIPAQEQAAIDAWMASDGGDTARTALLATPFWDIPTDRNDGRRSEAKLAMLDALRIQRRSHPSLRVALFDDIAFYTERDLRDARMADVLRSIRATSPAALLLVLTGNAHARRGEGATGNLVGSFRSPAPMASLLSELEPVTINITARSGSYWACKGGRCGLQRFATAAASDAGVRLIPLADDAPYHATLEFPAFEAAMPVAGNAVPAVRGDTP